MPQFRHIKPSARADFPRMACMRQTFGNRVRQRAIHHDGDLPPLQSLPATDRARRAATLSVRLSGL